MHITISSPQGLRFIDLCIFLYENCLEVELCGRVHTSFSKIVDLLFQICQLLALDSVFFLHFQFANAIGVGRLHQLNFFCSHPYH